MMARFSAPYVDKVFPFREPLQQLTDSRLQPIIPTSAVFLTAFMMFATHRPSLHAWNPTSACPHASGDSSAGGCPAWTPWDACTPDWPVIPSATGWLPSPTS